jgi:CRP-like cAMP-binding protein
MSQPAGDPRAMLSKVGMFHGLDAAGLDAVTIAARSRRVATGELLLRQDEPADRFYVVTEGRLRLTQVTAEGHQVIMGFVGPGGGLGIIAVLGRIDYPVSAEAVEDSELLGWDGEAFGELTLSHPQLAVNGMRLVAGRFRVVMDQLRELSTERVERRIARALLRLAAQAGRRTEQGILIDMPLSRQDLAEMTGTTVFTVSRTLKAWEGLGIVRLGRKEVCICEPHALTVIAEDLAEDEKKV